MSVTPTGSPAWVRATDFSQYGGDLNKANYQSQGAVDPLTDVTAEQLSRLAADVAAIARVSPFCVLSFTADDTGANHPTVYFVNMMTGVRAASYAGDAPPSGFPAVERVSDGVHTITFASTYADPFGAVGTFAPRMAKAGAIGTAGAPNFDPSVSISGQVVTVYATSGGAPVTDKSMHVEVW